MKKTIITIVGLIIIIIIGFYIYAIIMAKASQKMPEIETPKELRKLEFEIQEETHSGVGTFFNSIPKYEMESCNAILYLHVHLENDSLTQSKKIMNNYIISISERVNKEIIDKKCMDSLIVITKYYDRDKKRVENRFSFPISKIK